ncbi:hypothetical protein ACVWXU_008461 [Streptomyces sp. TE33382]
MTACCDSSVAAAFGTASPTRVSIFRKGSAVTEDAARTVSWPAGCRRLHSRYGRKAERFLAFVVAAILTCHRRPRQ